MGERPARATRVTRVTRVTRLTRLTRVTRVGSGRLRQLAIGSRPDALRVGPHCLSAVPATHALPPCLAAMRSAIWLRITVAAPVNVPDREPRQGTRRFANAT